MEQHVPLRFCVVIIYKPNTVHACTREQKGENSGASLRASLRLSDFMDFIQSCNV
jgi:hypothetical protein